MTTTLPPKNESRVHSTVDAAPFKSSRRGRPDQRKSIGMTVIMVCFAIYALLPLVWMLINSTKTYEGLLGSFGLWFADDFALFDNIAEVLTRNDGIYVRWFFNTILYVVLGAGGATILGALGGYGMAKYNFPGRKGVFAVVIGAVAIPGTALAVPTFLMFSALQLTDTMASVILPSLASPFGFYLMWVFARAIPTEVIEAARMDGSSEIRTFFTIALPMMAPGLVTVFLFEFVATWNNYFLPLIMLRDQALYPLSVGLQTWNLEAQGIQGGAVYHLVITASLLTVVPIILTFLGLQRFWQNGLTAGAVK
jgi:multiple sugar transport system permease protein